MSMTVRRAAERFHTVQPGIDTWHSFSAGAHYDAANVSFGPLIGVDEHLLAPGAGFDWHPHRGVRIISYVLAGALRHEDASGMRVVGAGEILEQDAAQPIRHAEGNASTSDGLRFIQLTVLAGEPATFDVSIGTRQISAARCYLLAAGPLTIGDETLADGDDARLICESLDLSGPGPALLWEFPP